MAELNPKYTDAIWALTETLQNEKQMESALHSCLELMTDTVGCEGGFAWLGSLEKPVMMIVACSNGNADTTGTIIRNDKGIVGHVLGTGETMALNGDTGEGGPLHASDEATGMTVKNQLVTAIRTYGDQPIGCIQLVNKSKGRFDEQDSHFAEQMASVVAQNFEKNQYEPLKPPREDPLIELKGVTKEYQSGDSVSMVLKGIDLPVFPEEFLVILGESGCGKTTLMNIIGGMDTMTSGEMLLEGKDFTRPGKKELTSYRCNYIGYIFQSYNLMPNLTALENIEFVAEIIKNPMKSEEALKMVGLSDKARNYPSQLSGGQQQRVSIGRALVKNPKLILADEPTAALDYETSIEVLSTLESVVKSKATTVVMVTHNSEIAKMADRVVKLRGGNISSIRINLNPLKAEDLVW